MNALGTRCFQILLFVCLRSLFRSFYKPRCSRRSMNVSFFSKLWVHVNCASSVSRVCPTILVRIFWPAWKHICSESPTSGFQVFFHWKYECTGEEIREGAKEQWAALQWRDDICFFITSLYRSTLLFYHLSCSLFYNQTGTKFNELHTISCYMLADA